MTAILNHTNLTPEDLAPHEQIIWSERANVTANVRARLGNVLLSIPCLLIACPGLAHEVASGSIGGALIASVFVVLGAGLALSPLLVILSASKTSYFITNRRLIISKRRGRSTISIDVSKIGQVERIRRDGKVTLRIPTTLVSDTDTGQRVDYTTMYDLTDGERAYRLLTQRG